jgi:lysophospholipase L1-like esterase
MTRSTGFTRRDFIATTTALVASARWPLAATAQPPQTPAPSTDGTVILFQGDSITDCGRNRSDAQPNAAGALGTGYPLLVAAAALATHPDRGLRFYNRGVSGNTVPDLEQRWAADTLELRPDVLSILIGVNDFWHKLGGGYTGTVQDYEDQYAALLERTLLALPRVRLVVLEPFVLRCGAVDNRWFPEFDARRAVAARVAAHARATFIPLQALFDERARAVPPPYWATDGVHPTPAGHAVIAEQWRRAASL